MPGLTIGGQSHQHSVLSSIDLPRCNSGHIPYHQKGAGGTASFYLYRGLRKALQYQAGLGEGGRRDSAFGGDLPWCFPPLTLLAYRRTFDRER